jgi:hypothetical protein
MDTCEKFEDTKRVIRSRKSKDKHNGQLKKPNLKLKIEQHEPQK